MLKAVQDTSDCEDIPERSGAPVTGLKVKRCYAAILLYAAIA